MTAAGDESKVSADDAGGSPTPAPSSDLVWQRLKGEAVIINLRTNKIYVLNSTAARFWELLDEGHGLAEIAARLRGEFDVEPGELEEELDALLKSLVAEDLVNDDPRS